MRSRRFQTQAAVSALGTLAVFATLAVAQEAADPAAAQRKAVFVETVNKLDLYGDVLVFVNTEDLLRNAMRYVTDLAGTLAESEPELAVAPVIAGKVGAFFEQNGLYAIRGLGFSTVPRPDHAFDLKLFLCRDPAAGSNALWRMLGGAPRTLTGLRYLPRDTVWMDNSNADLREGWQLLRRAIGQLGGPAALAGFDAALESARTNTGFDAGALMNAAGDEYFVSIQLSEQKTVTLPVGTNTLTFPEPGFLIGLAMRNPAVPEQLLQALAARGLPFIRTDTGGRTLYTLGVPVPLPFPVVPTFARHEGYLLIGSTPTRVEEAIRLAQSGGGLAATADFQKAFLDQPKEVNERVYVHPRFVQTVQALQLRMMELEGDPVAPNLMRKWVAAMGSGRFATVRINKPNGILVRGTVPQSGRQLIASTAVAPVGLLAAIAIPSFMNARTKSMQNACINNLRQIDGAKDQYALEHNNKAPTSLSDLAPAYIKRMPVCPKGGTYTPNPPGQEPTCSVPGHALTLPPPTAPRPGARGGRR